MADMCAYCTLDTGGNHDSMCPLYRPVISTASPLPCGDCIHAFCGRPLGPTSYPCAACRRNPQAEILDYFLPTGPPPR